MVILITVFAVCFLFFFQAEDGIRDLVRSRGLGDVYKRQGSPALRAIRSNGHDSHIRIARSPKTSRHQRRIGDCPLYTSDAADDLLCVDLGGRRIIQKKKITNTTNNLVTNR